MTRHRNKAKPLSSSLAGLWANTLGAILFVEYAEQKSPAEAPYLVSFAPLADGNPILVCESTTARMPAWLESGSRLLVFPERSRFGPRICLDFRPQSLAVELLVPSFATFLHEDLPGLEELAWFGSLTPYQKVPKERWNSYSLANLLVDLTNPTWHYLFETIDHLLDELSCFEGLCDSDEFLRYFPRSMMYVDWELRRSICNFNDQSTMGSPGMQVSICRATVFLSLLLEFLAAVHEQVDFVRSGDLFLCSQRLLSRGRECLEELKILCLPNEFKTIYGEVCLHLKASYR